jgi:hypothetical protein
LRNSSIPLSSNSPGTNVQCLPSARAALSTVLFEGLLDKHELLKIIQNFSSRSKINVIYDLLHLFVFDPHIDKADAKELLKEIARSLRKLSKDRPWRFKYGIIEKQGFVL